MRAFSCALLLLTTSLPSFGFLGSFFDRSPELIINTNITEAGAKKPVATPKNPVYIAAVSLGFEDFGNPIGGDNPPPEEKMKKILAKILRERGYLAGTKAHPPTQLITASWGTYYQAHGPVMATNGALLKFMGGDKLDLMWEASSTMAGGMLDPRVLLRGMRSGTSSMIMDMAYGSVYLLSIKAFDITEYRKNRLVMLWETNIACPADGLDIAETLPVMVVSAGPMLARETKTPEWFSEVDKHKAMVIVGEAEVVDYEANEKSGKK